MKNIWCNTKRKWGVIVSGLMITLLPGIVGSDSDAYNIMCLVIGASMVIFSIFYIFTHDVKEKGR